MTVRRHSYLRRIHKWSKCMEEQADVLADNGERDAELVKEECDPDNMFTCLDGHSNLVFSLGVALHLVKSTD